MVSGTEVCRIVVFCFMLWIIGPIVRVINGVWVLAIAATAGPAWMIGEMRRVGGRKRNHIVAQATSPVRPSENAQPGSAVPRTADGGRE